MIQLKSLTKNSHMIGKCCLLLLFSIVVGGLLIAAANYLPINATNKQAAIEQISQEGLFPEVPSLQGNYGNFQSMNPTALELATDALMLKMALYEGEDAGIEQAFRCYSTQYEAEYSRYWHGYVVILRALLMVFDYYEIRILNYFCQLLVFILIAFYLWKNKGVKYALVFASSYLLLMPMALSQCLQYTWAYYVPFIALLIYMYHRRFWESGNRYVYFFLLVGIAINYVDLLTYPLLSWGLVLVWWLLLQDEMESALGYLKKVVCSGIAWIAGYGGMWVGKWIMGSLVLRENLFRKAISEALLWTVNEGEAAITIKDRLHAMYLNWNTYDYKFYLILLGAWLLYWAVKTIFYGSSRNAKAPALLLVACSSIVWYLALAGHAIMHHIFTHRIYGVSIAAFLGMILLSTDNAAIDIKKPRKILIRIGAATCTCVVSVLLMSLMRDVFFHHNGEDTDFCNVTLSDKVQATFTPSYANVTHIHLGFYIMNGYDGYCQVGLLDGDTMVEERKLPFADYKEGNLHKVQVDWKLQAGHTYVISMQPVDHNGDFYIYYTSDGALPLPEFGELMLGNENSAGQPLAGVTYWCELTEKSMRMLYAGTYMAIFMMIWYSIWSTGFFFFKESLIIILELIWLKSVDNAYMK